jgi:hypothetical protein
MNLLEQYCESIKAGDAKKFVSLFTEDAVFNDTAPTKIGGDAILLNGKKEIEAMFEIVLSQGGLDITNICINGNAMRYDVGVGDVTLLALGVMKEENNLIKEYIVKAV